MVHNIRKYFSCFLKELNIYLEYDTASLPLVIYTRSLKPFDLHKNVHRIFICNSANLETPNIHL